MALTVESGTGAAGGNSYAAIATADTYHSDRGNSAWAAATTAAKTAALLNATAYLDGKYRHRWKGGRVNPVTQPLEWPRLGVNVESAVGGTPLSRTNYYSNYLSDTVPQEVIAATCELALRALTAPLAADITPRDRVKRKKIDVIETEYDTRSFATTYQVVDQLVSRFLKNPSEAVRG